MKVNVKELPEKIKDGCLLDAMVNLHFNTEYRQEVIEETVENYLNGIGGEDLFSKIPAIENGVIVPGRVFFANNTYRVMVVKDSLSFNIVRTYPTWQPYREFVKGVVENLLPKVTFVDLNVRYMSHFGNIPMFDYIDGSIYFNNIQTFQGAQYSFPCTVTDDVPGRIPAQAKVILSDRVEVVPGQLESMVDITVANAFVRGVSSDDVMNCLDFVHICEKHLFFTLISDEFYNKLKPEQ